MWQSLYDTNNLVAETMCQIWQEFPPEEAWCAWLGTSAEWWGVWSCTLDLTTKFTGSLCWDPCPCSISPLSGCLDTFLGLGANGWYTGAQFLDGLRCLWPGWLGASLQWLGGPSSGHQREIIVLLLILLYPYPALLLFYSLHWCLNTYMM